MGESSFAQCVVTQMETATQSARLKLQLKGFFKCLLKFYKSAATTATLHQVTFPLGESGSTCCPMVYVSKHKVAWDGVTTVGTLLQSSI